MTTITEEAAEGVSPTLDEAIAIGLDGLPPATDANLHYLANTDFNGVHVKAAARELLVRRYMASRPSAPQAEGRDTGLIEQLAVELSRSSLAHAFPDRDSVPMSLVEPLIASFRPVAAAAVRALSNPDRENK